MSGVRTGKLNCTRHSTQRANRSAVVHRWHPVLQGTSFMIKTAFVGIMILLMPSLALTEPILTITCHEPKGKRMEYGVFPNEHIDAIVKKKAPPKPRLRTVD